MVSPGSLEVQCAIYCATEPHKKFFSLCQSIGVMLRARWVGRTRSLGLCTIGMQFEKQRHCQGLLSKKEPAEKSHRLRGIAGIRTQDLLFTRQALWPAMPRCPAGSSFLWQAAEGVVCKPNRQRHWRSSAPLALLCTSVCIPFSDRKTTKPKVMLEHTFQRHRWDSNPGSPVYKTGALTSYATAPAGSSILWQQLRGGLQTKSPAALALLCTPFAFRSRIRKTH